MRTVSWDLSQPRILARATFLVIAAHVLFLVLVGALPFAGDAVAFHDLALSILQNHSYVFWGETEVGYMPGYPLFISLGYAFFGARPWVVHLMQCALIGITCALYFRTLQRLFNERVAALGFWTLALLPAFYVYATTLNAEIYVLFAATFVLWTLGRLKDADTIPNSARFGFAVALLCLAKPEFSVWVLAGALLALGARRPLTAVARSFAVSAAMMALTIAPWTIRNALAFGKFIPLSVSSGRALWITAHRPALFDYNGPEFNAALSVCKVVGDPKSTDDCLKAQAIAMIKEHPASYLVGCAKRASSFLFGSHTEYFRGFTESFGTALHEHHYGVFFAKAALLAIHSAIASLGIVGIAWLARKREWVFLAYLVATKILVHLVVFATPRYSLHLMPYFILGAAWLATRNISKPSEPTS